MTVFSVFVIVRDSQITIVGVYLGVLTSIKIIKIKRVKSVSNEFRWSVRRM